MSKRDEPWDERFAFRRLGDPAPLVTAPPSQAMRELARRALEALKAREGEDVHAWAYKLVEDVINADD